MRPFHKQDGVLPEPVAEPISEHAPIIGGATAALLVISAHHLGMPPAQGCEQVNLPNLTDEQFENISVSLCEEMNREMIHRRISEDIHREVLNFPLYPPY
ncbi:MAG: hypothetical protein NTZ18_00030 [Candidatus Komeilibacteria bacterium]|nr:hypothetical protein [Candidatus Komeilibacteria bacterium]